MASQRPVILSLSFAVSCRTRKKHPVNCDLVTEQCYITKTFYKTSTATNNVVSGKSKEKKYFLFGFISLLLISHHIESCVN